ncbi:MAG: hypothetical protein AAF211_09085, partial [Myxococcota bacterium]
MQRFPAKLAYLDVPDQLQAVLRPAFERVWSGPQIAVSASEDDEGPARVAVVSHDTPRAAWEAVEAFDRRHPFVPVVAVLEGARDFRNRKRTYPARVDWIADFKELGESSLRMAIRFARERARRRELEHRLEERHLEDYGWILSEVAHEIRDPLQSLTANLEWAEAQVGHLQQYHDEIDLERLQEAVRDSRSGLVVVSRIAADLDRSSRSMRLGRVDLREVFDTLRRLTRKSLRDVTLTIRHGHGPTVRASET